MDLLKGDIEGYERLLFRQSAGWLNLVRCVVGEIHEGYEVAELAADLKPYGFHVEPHGCRSAEGQQIFIASRDSGTMGLT